MTHYLHAFDKPIEFVSSKMFDRIHCIFTGATGFLFLSCAITLLFEMNNVYMLILTPLLFFSGFLTTYFSVRAVVSQQQRRIILYLDRIIYRGPFVEEMIMYSDIQHMSIIGESIEIRKFVGAPYELFGGFYTYQEGAISANDIYQQLKILFDLNGKK